MLALKTIFSRCGRYARRAEELGISVENIRLVFGMKSPRPAVYIAKRLRMIDVFLN